MLGEGVGGAGGQSKCEGDERGFSILSNVTDASDTKFRVSDPSRLSRLLCFQRWHIFTFRIIKMLSRRGRENIRICPALLEIGT